MKFVVKLCIALSILFNFAVHAAWDGPVTVLTASWGSEPEEFYVDWGDTPVFAVYPSLDDISNDGIIAVSDESNVKLYSSDGKWIRNLPITSGLVRFVGNNVAILSEKLEFRTTTGVLVKTNDANGDSNEWGIGGDLYVSVLGSEEWKVYSENGQLLNDLKEKPLVLGRVESNLFYYGGKKLHRNTVKFPDKEWSVVNNVGPCGEYGYREDSNGHLYCIGSTSVERLSDCGKVTTEFTLPSTKENLIKNTDPGAEADVTIIEKYLDPHLTTDGSIFASKITQDGYSVVKWTWQNSSDDPVGGPDAPVQLEGVSDTTGSVMLKWVYSLQDPGCVTGYEVGRATSAGGPYTAIGTVQNGDISKGYSYHDTTGKSGTTYYYAVRAVSAIGDSPYSNEVSVSVK